MYGNNNPFMMPNFSPIPMNEINIINDLALQIENLQKQITRLEEIINNIEKININKKNKDDDVYII